MKPALGPELDVAVVSAGNESSTKAVALTKPDDPAKFKALVAKLNAKDSSGDRAVYREVDGWYALSDSQASISRALEGNAPLADDADFKEAMGKLPGDALAKVYLDGQRLNALVPQSSLLGHRCARARQAEVRSRLGERGGRRRACPRRDERRPRRR